MREAADSLIFLAALRQLNRHRGGADCYKYFLALFWGNID